MENIRFLNPDDFKRWMNKQDESDIAPPASELGASVEAKHCGRRTARLITLESGRAGKVVREFLQQGGIIRGVEGDEYLVEVESGSFYINKRNVIF